MPKGLLDISRPESKPWLEADTRRDSAAQAYRARLRAQADHQSHASINSEARYRLSIDQVAEAYRQVLYAIDELPLEPSPEVAELMAAIQQGTEQ